MKKHFGNNNNENEEFGFWQSYSDLMSALLLMFVLMMSAVLLQSMTRYQTLIEEETLIQKELDSQRVEQQKLIDQIGEQSEQLQNQQEQIEKFIGVKENIIVSLSEEFEKTDLIVEVDPNTGAIMFDSNILFKSNSSEISEQGEKFLENFIPVYFDAMMNTEYSSFISEIIIEGHTDTDGDYMYNLELSQKRALAVCKYCLDYTEENTDFDISTIRKILTANGKSWSNPIYEENGKIVDKNASRRVEFKFSLKDDEMINSMKEIIENE